MKRFSSTTQKLSVAIVSLAALISLSGCAPQEGIAKDFMRKIFAGNARDALVLLCVDGGVDAIVSIQADWSNDVYKVLHKDDSSSQVLASGRLIISEENLERYLPVIQEVLSDQGYDVPTLPEGQEIGAGVQFGVNFDDFHLKYDDLRKEWCVDGDSYYGLLKYLVDMVVKEVTRLSQ